MNQEEFFRKKIEKLDEQAKKLANGNQEIRLDTILYQSLNGKSLDGLNNQELSDLAKMIDAKVNALEERIDDLRAKETLLVLQPSVEVGIGSNNNSRRLPPLVDFLKEQTWFMEAMNPDEHVGPSNGAGVVKPFDAEDFTHGFSGDI
ncbi:uncharacterized protein [Aristolochia californica]|uniref:uncharacterized protein n=1 Tax=Aristolochia californica TaxID=171875 RepID=UPI0035D5A8F9